MTNPTPEQIYQSRTDAGLKQTEAAALIGKTSRMWQTYEWGRREIPPELWELFLLKTNQHPTKKLVDKSEN